MIYLSPVKSRFFFLSTRQLWPTIVLTRRKPEHLKIVVFTENSNTHVSVGDSLIILVNARVVIEQNDFKMLPLLCTRYDVIPLFDPIMRVRAIHGSDCFSPRVHDSHRLLFSRIVGFENFKEHSHYLASDSSALISFSAQCP